MKRLEVPEEFPVEKRLEVPEDFPVVKRGFRFIRFLCLSWSSWRFIIIIYIIGWTRGGSIGGRL